MSVQELEAAVAKLKPDDLARFAAWFEDFQADEWDRQIEADAEAGKLDGLLAEAEADIAAGRVRPLP